MFRRSQDDGLVFLVLVYELIRRKNRYLAERCMCVYVCAYVCIYNGNMILEQQMDMYVCMYVCMYVYILPCCMYVCTHLRDRE